MTETERLVITVAKAIAQSAPAKRSKYVYAAQIPWQLIQELRTALELAQLS